MKATINKNSKNLSVNKSITLAIALALSTLATAATPKAAQQQNPFEADSTLTGKTQFAPVEDQAIFNPSVLFTFTAPQPIEATIAENNKIIEDSTANEMNLLFIEKSIEEIIADDNKIIESAGTAELRPLYLEKTVEDQIAEDNAIIESTPVEAQPLDLDSINKTQLGIKQKSLLIGMN